MPRSFQSLDEANIYLDAISAEIDRILGDLYDVTGQHVERRSETHSIQQGWQYMLATVLSRTVELDQQSHLVLAMNKVHADLTLWQVAFSNIQSTMINKTEYTLTRIYFFYLLIRAQTWRDETEEVSSNPIQLV